MKNTKHTSRLLTAGLIFIKKVFTSCRINGERPEFAGEIPKQLNLRKEGIMNGIKIILLIAGFLFFAACGQSEPEVMPELDEVVTVLTEEEPAEETESDVSESEVSEENMPDDLGEIPAYVTIGGEEYSTALTELDLGGRELGDDDIQNLRYMLNLTWLGLLENQISDLTPIAGVVNLTRLSLNGNQISDIMPLAGLVNLEMLWLGDNPITDWSPVDHVELVGGRD